MQCFDFSGANYYGSDSIMDFDIVATATVTDTGTGLTSSSGGSKFSFTTYCWDNSSFKSQFSFISDNLLISVYTGDIFSNFNHTCDVESCIVNFNLADSLLKSSPANLQIAYKVGKV